MATVKDIKATVRPRAGKGAARAVRREGRVPGVIYGNNQPPLNISLDHAELRQRIYAGHFLTTIHDVEVDGAKHRVIPRDFQLDAVLVVEGPMAKRQPVGCELAGQVFLRQRRPLIRELRLVAHQDDPALEALASQGVDGLRAGLAAANDEDRGGHGHTSEG